MNRTNRIALLGAAVLLVVLAGSALATRAPVAEEASRHQATDPETPDPEAVQRAGQRLAASGIEANQELLTELAAEYGLGGAIRIVAWSSETGMAVDEIRALRGEGRGWGEIAKALGVHPGIGSIMGNGGGLGRENAPGQQKDRVTDG